MVLSGPSTPIGGAQSVSPALLHSNSGILGSQGTSIPPQASYSSLVSPRAQYNLNLLGNNPNISSLLNQTLGNGGSNSGISGIGSFQRGNVDNPTESDPLSNIANDIGFTVPSSFAMANMSSSGSSAQVQNQQISNNSGGPMLSEQSQSQVQQFELQKFQNGQRLMQQFPISHSQPQQHQLQHQQQQIQSMRGGLGNVGPVKLEQQTMNDPIGPQQQLQSLQNLGPVRQELQMGRGIGPIKLEHQHSDQAMLLQQQQRQQQQQLLHLSRQSSQAAVAQMNYFQQQRILQLQQQQQQQILKALPQQRPQLQQQLPQQNMSTRSAVRPLYEPGTCARRLNQYIYQQQHRPDDNNIEFWRRFVGEFFAPIAKKRWCVSLYGNSRHTNGVFPQDSWHCQICNRKPGRGFETTAEVLPRLFKIKYDSGTLEEFLYVDMPREYQNASGQIVLDYAKVIQESVFEHLRVVRDGQLRIVFSPDLKICSWEFCARCHEELIPRRLFIPQVSQLGAAAQKYQASAQSASSTSPSPDLLSNCNMFVASARQLAKALEVPLVNDLGYTKRYVRCLQISEVVNSMKDLIDYSRETGNGPIESLAKFPRRTSSSSEPHNSAQHDEQQQITGQNLNDDHHSAQASVGVIMDILRDFHMDCAKTKSKLENCGVKASSELVVEVLSRVRNDWETAFTFFLWAGNQEGYAHSVREYHSMISILGKMRKFDTAWALIDEMRRGWNGRSLLTPQALLILIRRYCAVHDVGRAINTFYAYKRFNFDVGVEEFQSLLSALCRYKNVQDAEQLMFCNKDVFPFDTKSFNIILNGWCNVICSKREAERVWNEMGRRRIQYDAVSYGSIMSCYSKANNLYKVLRLFDHMKKMGIDPDRKVYNAVIHALAKGKMLKDAINLMKTMEEKGITPNVVTYNSLIKPLCKARKIDEAKGAFDEMLQRGLSPTIQTYHAFFRFFRTGEEVFELLGKMREIGCQPTNDTYIMLIRKFCRWRHFDNVFKIWDEMSENVGHDLSSYIVLIHGLFLNGKVEEAHKYYVEMKEQQFLPDPKTDEMLKTWFSSKQFLDCRMAELKDNQLDCGQSTKQTKAISRKLNHNQDFLQKPEIRRVVRERGFSFWEE